MIPLFLFSIDQKTPSKTKSSFEFDAAIQPEMKIQEQNICEKIEDWIQTKILSENNIVD